MVRFDDTLIDADQPWLGPSDLRGGGAETLVVDAVFVPPSGVTDLGLSVETDDLLKNSDEVMIISAGADVNLSGFTEVVDVDSLRWKINVVRILQPGSVVILAYFGISR